MLTIKDLSVSYKKGNEVLKDIDLSMEEGQIHGLAGFNGSGKTTLLNTIFHFIKPDKGNILYNDEPLRRKEIAYLESENYFYPYMTGNEYLALFNEDTGFKLKRWQELLALPLDDITESYSTGMRKKLALLAVIKQNKPVMILDEPFNSLDLETVHLLIMILDRLRAKGKTILITSHIFESLTNCCDYIHHLQDGVITHSYDKENFPLLKHELQSIMEQRSGDLLNKLL